MKLASFIAQLPPEFRIVFADVGSAGGLHGRWAGLRPIVNGLLFEPREGGATRRDGPDTIYPIGLGSEAGKAILNVTALANMSSTLEPNVEEIGRYAKKPAHTQVIDRLGMSVETLDAVAKRENLRIDALKLDTQGSELEIIVGARESLKRSVVLAEVEISFFRRYRDQPLFCDVAAQMAQHGFEPIDLYRLKRYRWANTSGVGNLSLGAGQRAGRLAYADTIFFLTERELLARLADAAPSRAEHMSFP